MYVTGQVLLPFFSFGVLSGCPAFDVSNVLMEALESVDGPRMRSLRPFHTDGALMVSGVTESQ
jgi:hypothetical protein